MPDDEPQSPPPPPEPEPDPMLPDPGRDSTRRETTRHIRMSGSGKAVAHQPSAACRAPIRFESALAELIKQVTGISPKTYGLAL